MTSIKDWVFSQVVSKSVGATRLLSSSDRIRQQESPNEELESLGVTQTSSNFTSRSVSNESPPSNDVPRTLDSTLPRVENLPTSNSSPKHKKLDPIAKVEALQVKFLRLLRRLGQSPNNLLVAKVLYRIQLSALIRAGESDLERAALRSDKAQLIAAEQEETGVPDLEFSLKILVLGKTGVGKSATVNSILGESKVLTNAFSPATDQVQEIMGTVGGIKVSFIDTPGLLPSSANSLQKNRKILQSVKQHIRKSRPDIVLYFERLDLLDVGYVDFPLLKLITDTLGPAIWFSTSVVLTHSWSLLPEYQNGLPISFETQVRYCTQLLQHNIQLAVSDRNLENPVVLVENHPHCKVDRNGNRILPNGQAWSSQFMLLCICTKVLSDVNKLMQFGDSIQLGPVATARSPSLPHMLSSFLKYRGGPDDDDLDELSLSDADEEDEYDQLPPIRILTKAQFQKLTPPQKKAYLDELDYRETLFLKKQLKQEKIARREKAGSEVESDDNYEGSSDPIMLPDMDLPPCFDSVSPVHRFHFIVTNDQWLARPVLNLHGWDHDVGFDGVNLEIASEIRENVITNISGQISKDKQEFTLQSQSNVSFLHPNKGPTYSMGLDVQSSGKDLMCSVRGNTRLKSIKRNVAEFGVSATSFLKKYYYGAKIEDSISVNKRLKLKMNFGGVAGLEKGAYGGGFEAVLKGRDFPVRDEKLVLSMNVVCLEKESVVGGNLSSDFRLSRDMKVSINANLNSRKMGQICVKVKSCEHMEIASLVLVASVLRGLLRKKPSKEEDEEESI